MTEDRFAEEVCDDFEINAVKWKNHEYYHAMGVVVYYQAALRVVHARPFRSEFVQNKVVTFLDIKLTEACEHMMHGSLQAIRKRIATLEDDD